MKIIMSLSKRSLDRGHDNNIVLMQAKERSNSFNTIFAAQINTQPFLNAYG